VGLWASGDKDGSPLESNVRWLGSLLACQLARLFSSVPIGRRPSLGSIGEHRKVIEAAGEQKSTMDAILVEGEM